MYYDYIMIIISSTDSDDKNIRTQITLGSKLKAEAEKRAKIKGVSLSEYLRRALMIHISLEDKKEENLEKLADMVVGSVDLDKHPEWRSKKEVIKWSRKIREEWQRN